MSYRKMYVESSFKPESLDEYLCVKTKNGYMIIPPRTKIIRVKKYETELCPALIKESMKDSGASYVIAEGRLFLGVRPLSLKKYHNEVAKKHGIALRQGTHIVVYNKIGQVLNVGLLGRKIYTVLSSPMIIYNDGSYVNTSTLKLAYRGIFDYIYVKDTGTLYTSLNVPLISGIVRVSPYFFRTRGELCVVPVIASGKDKYASEIVRVPISFDRIDPDYYYDIIDRSRVYPYKFCWRTDIVFV